MWGACACVFEWEACAWGCGYVCTRVDVWICMYIRIWVCIWYVCVGALVWMCLHAYMCVCDYVWVHMCECGICMCVCAAMYLEVRETIVRRRGDDLVNSAEKGLISRVERYVFLCMAVVCACNVVCVCIAGLCVNNMCVCIGVVCMCVLVYIDLCVSVRNFMCVYVYMLACFPV